MNQYFTNAGVFLVDAILGFLASIVMLRILLQAVHANFHNPICQFLYRFTNPVVMPLRRAIPSWRQWDLAALFLCVLILLIKVSLINLMAGPWIYKAYLNLPGILVATLAELISLVVMVLLVAIIIRVLIGWIAPGNYSPATPLLRLLTEPLLAPVRRVVPTAAGMDFSTLIVSIGLILVRLLVVDPTLGLAAAISR